MQVQIEKDWQNKIEEKEQYISEQTSTYRLELNKLNCKIDKIHDSYERVGVVTGLVLWSAVIVVMMNSGDYFSNDLGVIGVVGMILFGVLLSSYIFKVIFGLFGVIFNHVIGNYSRRKRLNRSIKNIESDLRETVEE